MKNKFLLLTSLVIVMLFTSKAHAQDSISYEYHSHICDSESFTVVCALSYSTTGTLTSYFGDGTSATRPVDTMGYFFFSHVYGSPGVYTIKHVLTIGGAAVDSVTVADTIDGCHIVGLNGYIDNNSNCLNDLGDGSLLDPMTVEIDSAGVPIDTIIATNFRIPAYGPSGTIYRFKVLTPPAGLAAACPTTGIVYDTIGTTTGIRGIGFECGTITTSFDLSEIVHVGGPAGICGMQKSMCAMPSAQPMQVRLPSSAAPSTALLLPHLRLPL